MMQRLPLDIASDLTLSIGDASVKITPRMGLRYAESLLQVSTRALVRETAEEERARIATEERKRKR